MKNKKIEYAWFSKNQFGSITSTQYEHDSKHDYPYIYYQIIDDNNNKKVVQITEINNSKKSYFEDAIYLGKVVKFIRAYEKPQNIENIDI
jgi:hypothetical protein